MEILPRVLLCCLLSSGVAQTVSAQQAPNRPVLPWKTRSILNAITAGELKGDLSFLASDALAGRFTPSPGLEVAAEFIASKFRAIGLEPGGHPDYFQIATMVERRLPKMEHGLTVETGSTTVEVRASDLNISQVSQAAAVSHAPVIGFPLPDVEVLRKADVAGKVIVLAQPDFRKLPHDKAMAEYLKVRAFTSVVQSSAAALELVVTETNGNRPEVKLISQEEAQKKLVPVLLVANPDLRRWLQEMATGGSHAGFASVEVPAPDDRKITAKNVIGVLRGSDPKLKETCVLLTAHYDHIGTIETAQGLSSPPPNQTADRIYNGANDDGSGTVSVLEIARALAKVTPRPKRSIVFITFFGEERGELGSEYYAGHPLFPLPQTVADVNLEQVGQTDSTAGKQVNTASLTGYDYSDVTKYLERAGGLTGIKVYKDAQASDAYFTQSDNSALADHGVPAHSLTVAFDYPDYHGLGDEWQKIDYDNMARVDRMIALGVWNIADDPKPPLWNALNPKTSPFREAQRKARGH